MNYSSVRNCVALIGLLCTSTVLAQYDELLEELTTLCQEVRCYPAETITVVMADGESMELHMRFPSPIVQDGWVSLFPGKSIYLTAEIRDGALVNVTAIDEPDEKVDIIHVRMYQEPGRPDTFLVVTNFFSEIIKYRAGMMLPDGDDLYATSSCPVMGDGRAVYEHWPQPIFQLVMADFRVIPGDAETFVCD